MFEKRRKEIETRRAEIRALLAGEDAVDMDALEKELDELETEERELDRRQAASRRISGTGTVPENVPESTPGPVNPIAGSTPDEARGAQPAGVERRAAYLAELQGIPAQEAETRAQQFAQNGRMEVTAGALCRALTLASGNIAQPTRVSGINEGQNIVSGIVDLVRVVDANGMGEDAVAYEVSGGQTAGTRKDDGSVSPDSSPNLKIAKITPTMISTLSYVSRNIRRTTPLNYQSRVSEGAMNALRKKTGGLIVTGDPSAAISEPTGILKAAAIDAGTDVTIARIDQFTLRKLALSYGGANNVEGGGVLLLNKADLIAFGDVRGTNEKKAVYEIEFGAGSTTVGTIKDGGLAVRFCIVDELPALSDAATADGATAWPTASPWPTSWTSSGPTRSRSARTTSSPRACSPCGAPP